MKRFATTITIRARPETIWALLTDADGYPQWNSTVERVDGRIAAGGRITVHAKSAPGRAFPLQVTEFVPLRKMVWAGGMPLGLFTGTRSFVLMPTPSGEVGFAMDETYGGLLAPLITRLIPDLQPAFNTFAADLKRRAEALPARAGS
jgi:hypothetical protein